MGKRDTGCAATPKKKSGATFSCPTKARKATVQRQNERRRKYARRCKLDRVLVVYIHVAQEHNVLPPSLPPDPSLPPPPAVRTSLSPSQCMYRERKREEKQGRRRERISAQRQRHFIRQPHTHHHPVAPKDSLQINHKAKNKQKGDNALIEATRDIHINQRKRREVNANTPPTPRDPNIHRSSEEQPQEQIVRGS